MYAERGQLGQAVRAVQTPRADLAELRPSAGLLLVGAELVKIENVMCSMANIRCEAQLARCDIPLDWTWFACTCNDLKAFDRRPMCSSQGRQRGYRDSMVLSSSSGLRPGFSRSKMMKMGTGWAELTLVFKMGVCLILHIYLSRFTIVSVLSADGEARWTFSASRSQRKGSESKGPSSGNAAHIDSVQIQQNCMGSV